MMVKINEATLNDTVIMVNTLYNLHLKKNEWGYIKELSS